MTTNLFAPHELPQLAALQGLLDDPTKPPSTSRAWRAVRELAAMTGPATEAAIVLVARFAEIAEPPSDKLLPLWRDSPDRDAFARLLLAPAFARENRTELDLGRKLPLTGIRHLMTLRTLRAYRRKDITDLGELSALIDLTDLNLDGCRNVRDLTPLANLIELTTLNLQHGAVCDLTPLAGLTRLTALDLNRCHAITDLTPLVRLTRLRSLGLAETRIRDLTHLASLTTLTELLT
ncbi:hypothetical protein ACFWDI_27550 [Streptomyces sp. NPDC060064]|uniref:hypothetical protein n=1 Tax=Streptomyces sp. NPDC060064 TaxID=3347049 RepID=UPI0036D04936